MIVRKARRAGSLVGASPELEDWQGLDLESPLAQLSSASESLSKRTGSQATFFKKSMLALFLKSVKGCEE